MGCIYCKIIKKELPAAVVFESEDILAFKDIHPIAPVHILIIPKRHIENINNLKESDTDMAGRMIMAAQKIARELLEKIAVPDDRGPYLKKLRGKFPAAQSPYHLPFAGRETIRIG